MRKPLIFLLSLCLTGVLPGWQSIASAQALSVRFSFHDHPITLKADFVPGPKTKPAVLILHGFLTTHRFPTVQAMRQSAEGVDLAVLTPTLSYDYPDRKQTLKCTSLHRHTVDDALAEIDFWLRWLQQQGYRSVILAGHSNASTLLLHYVETHPRPPLSVRGLVLTSLFYVSGPEMGTRPQELALARKMVNRGDRTPKKWHHLFCNGSYLATAQSYLSYQQTFTRAHLLQALRKVQAHLPVHIIMGGDDTRFAKTGRDLLNAYEQSGAQLHIIEQANHFFSDDHEFDLQERLEEILNALAA